MKNKIINVAITGIMVIGGTIFATTWQSSMSAAPGSSASAANTRVTQAATITYTAGGFFPTFTTVRSGQVVTFTNNSPNTIQINSNDAELNIGTILPYQSRSVVLTRRGTYSFQNQLNPSRTASITVL